MQTRFVLLLVLAGLISACENGSVSVETKADTLFNKVDSAAEKIGASAKEKFKEIRSDIDSAIDRRKDSIRR